MDSAPRRIRGFVVRTAPGAEADALAVLPDPAAALAGGALLKRNRYRAVARVDLPAAGPAVLKVHVPAGAADVLRAAVRPSRAAQEWRAARYLLAAGIPTAEPILVAERRSGPFLRVAAFATRWLDGRASFEPALRARGARDAQALLARATAILRALHDRGASHGDLHGGNVLVGEGPAHRCDLRILDLHTMRVGRPVSPRRRRAQLARWLHSLALWAGPGARLRGLLAYLGSRPPREELRREWRALSARILRWERRRRRSRSRRCVEENVHFTSEVGAGRGWRRTDLPVARLSSAIEEHERALAEGAPTVLKRGRKHLLTRHGDVVVKEAVEASLPRRLEGRLLPLARRRGYHNAHRLDVRGVGTALPLAFLRRGGRTFTLYEDLSALPRLDHRVRDALRSGAWDLARKRDAIDATADFTAMLHRRGVWHGDLKACNWLLDERGGGLSFRLVDTDRVRFFRGGVPRSRRLRNIAQLAASIPVVVTRADRLRWWRRYARGTGLAGREEERRAARDVARLLARKTVVVDAPIE